MAGKERNLAGLGRERIPIQPAQPTVYPKPETPERDSFPRVPPKRRRSPTGPSVPTDMPPAVPGGQPQETQSPEAKEQATEPVSSETALPAALQQPDIVLEESSLEETQKNPPTDGTLPPDETKEPQIETEEAIDPVVYSPELAPLPEDLEQAVVLPQTQSPSQETPSEWKFQSEDAGQVALSDEPFISLQKLSGEVVLPEPMPEVQSGVDTQSFFSPPESPEVLAAEPERQESVRWSIAACWRLVSSHPHAFDTEQDFTGEEIRPGMDGLYSLHKDVGSSLQAHLRSIQKKEWSGVTVPRSSAVSLSERTKAAQWESAKEQFSARIGKIIVPDNPTTTPSQLAQGEITETFAYKLFHWMQESMRIVTSLYRQYPSDTMRISKIFSLVGVSGLPTTLDEVQNNSSEEIMVKGLWNVYRELHMRGKNSCISFIRQVAGGLKAQHNGELDVNELYFAMDMFRKLPFFGKEGNLMDAIELATTAISQPEGAYSAGSTVLPLFSNSKESKTIAYIGRKIPVSSQRRFVGTSRSRWQDGKKVKITSSEDEEEE